MYFISFSLNCYFSFIHHILPIRKIAINIVYVLIPGIEMGMTGVPMVGVDQPMRILQTHIQNLILPTDKNWLILISLITVLTNYFTLKKGIKQDWKLIPENGCLEYLMLQLQRMYEIFWHHKIYLKWKGLCAAWSNICPQI